MDRMPPQWRRDLQHRLEWSGKAGSKWFQLMKKSWSASYTWQNLAGGYMSKDYVEHKAWGIHPAYLTQGKVAYTGHIDAKNDKKVLTEHNLIRVLAITGRRGKYKTAKDALRACIAEKYSVHRLKGKIDWTMVEWDYQNKVHNKVPRIDDVMLAAECRGPVRHLEIQGHPFHIREYDSK